MFIVNYITGGALNVYKKLTGQNASANKILNNLWLGDITALDANYIKVNNYDIIINCTKNIPFPDVNVKKYRIPVDDSLSDVDIYKMLNYLYKIVRIIDLELSKGKKILVHCYAGIQRSATVVASYLMKKYSLSKEQAISYIRKRRPIAFTPMVNFNKTLSLFSKGVYVVSSNGNLIS